MWPADLGCSAGFATTADAQVLADGGGPIEGLYACGNDMGSVMMEENVVSAAGTTYSMSEGDIRLSIVQAGWQPRKRDCYYGIIEE